MVEFLLKGVNVLRDPHWQNEEHSVRQFWQAKVYVDISIYIYIHNMFDKLYKFITLIQYIDQYVYLHARSHFCGEILCDCRLQSPNALRNTWTTCYTSKPESLWTVGLFGILLVSFRDGRFSERTVSFRKGR